MDEGKMSESLLARSTNLAATVDSLKLRYFIPMSTFHILNLKSEHARAGHHYSYCGTSAA